MLRTLVILVFLGEVYKVTSATTIKATCAKVVDIALVVDESGSIGADNFTKIKLFLSEAVSRFSVSSYGARFALVKYSTDAQLVFSFDTYNTTAKLQDSIENMGYRQGGTQTGKALEFTRLNVFNQTSDRRYVPNVLVLFSDGESHDHKVAMVQAKLMKDDGVTVLCVGIGDGTLKDTLKKQLTALASNESYYFETVFHALDKIENDLVNQTCDAINPCKTKPCQNNGTCSTVDDDSYQCNCSMGYFGIHCEIEDPCNATPCLNNATCSTFVNGSYQCTCKVGYSGDNCETQDFKGRGCSYMKLAEERTLLLNRRSEMNLYVWTAGWDDFLETSVRRCFGKAKENYYEIFWLEFFGVCYGGNLTLSNYAEQDPGTSDCWGKRPDFSHCQVNEATPICVGVGDYGYIYEVVS